MNLKTLEKFKNKWAVIDEKSNEIVSAKSTYAEAYKEASKIKLENLYIKYIVALK
jgi:hypothetical protein